MTEFKPDMRAAPMTIDLTGDDSEHIISVSGELDLSTAPQLQGSLQRTFLADTGPILIDLRDLTFIDSTGLGVLVAARQRAKASGVDLTMELPEGDVLYVFEITGLADILRRP